MNEEEPLDGASVEEGEWQQQLNRLDGLLEASQLGLPAVFLSKLLSSLLSTMTQSLMCDGRRGWPFRGRGRRNGTIDP